MIDHRRNPALLVSLIGPFRMRATTGYHSLNLSGTTRNLLAYLMANAGKVTRREVLVELFWPDSNAERGRSALTTALCRIKKVLGKIEGLELEAFDDLVTLTAGADVEIDALDLERCYDAARRQLNDDGELVLADRRALASLLREASGVFLDGSDAHWVLVERERVLALQISALRLMMRDAEARGAYDDAIDWAQRTLAADPLLEAVHYQLIDLYAKAGERRRAILQYERLWEILRDELGIEPDKKTTALRDKIITQAPAAETRPSPCRPMRPAVFEDGDDAVTRI